MCILRVIYQNFNLYNYYHKIPNSNTAIKNYYITVF